MDSIQLNETAPDFTMKDYNGNVLTLSDFKDDKHVVLVLNRGLS